MTEHVATYADSRSCDAFCVAAPYASDVVADTLRMAYNDRQELPDLFNMLLDRLDRID
jgi:hypothetical protein